MTDFDRPDGERAGTGSVGRGVALTAVAVALGAAVLASNKLTGTTPTTSSVGAGTTPAASSPPTTGGSASRTPTTTTTLPAHQPGSVKVLVANGTSTKGVAGKLATKLTSAGYDVLSPTNTTSTASASVVYYGAGYQGDAVAIAQSIGLTTSAIQAMGTGSSSTASSSGSSGSSASGSGGASGSSSSGSSSGAGPGGAAAPVSDTKGAEIVVVVGPDLVSSLSS